MYEIQVGDCVRHKNNLYIVDGIDTSSCGKKGVFVYTRNSHYRQFIYMNNVELVAKGA